MYCHFTPFGNPIAIQCNQSNRALVSARLHLHHTHTNTQSYCCSRCPITRRWLAGWTTHLCHRRLAVLQRSDRWLYERRDSLCVAWKILATDNYWMPQWWRDYFQCPDLNNGKCMQSVTWMWCMCTFAQTWVKISLLLRLTFSPERVHLNACSQSHISVLYVALSAA